MASNSTKSVNKPTKDLLKKENAAVTHANNPLESFNFNDVAAQHEQASFNVAQYRPGDEHKPVKTPHKIQDKIYYIYGANSHTDIDQSGTAGKQELSGTFSIYDSLGNTTLTLTLNAVELTAYQPVYEGRYIDDIFENNWFTPYGKWTYWVTTDDGMDMTITTTVTGLAPYLADIQYESDEYGNPVGEIPDFGTPWLVNPTVKDIEQILGITWEPTAHTDIFGITKNYLLYQSNEDNYRHPIITKENALVFLPVEGGSSFGSKFGDTFYASGENHTIYGFGGNDTIVGGAGYDYIFGGEGNDVLIGGGGDDEFYLYTNAHNIEQPEDYKFVLGKDTITGGSGVDRLYFGGIEDGSENKLNIDRAVVTITDFTAGEDVLSFRNLSILSDNLVQGVRPIAQDSDDYVLFDTSTKKLYIDADGSGNQYQAEHFATLVGFNGILSADGNIT